MRIGLIIYDSINTITGGYIYDSKLVDYLRSCGVIVKIFSQPHKSFFGLIKNNFSKKILNEIIAFSPDILLQDEMNFISLFFLNRKLKKIVNFPIISIVHVLQSTLKYRFITAKIEKIYLHSVDGFIYNSIATKKSVEAVVGDHQTSLVAYPGKDRLIFEERPSKNYNNRLKVIFVGNIMYNKGLHDLINALSEINSTLWQLSIIGGLHFDQKYSNQIVNMISRLKLEKNILLKGLLNTENLKEELLTHHVLVVPSYYESFGIVYTEAMGAGLPVIASRSGGAQEIVEDGVNGFLVAPGDAVMIRNHIEQLITHRELLIKMSHASILSYKSLPCWDETMKKVYSFLSSLSHN